MPLTLPPISRRRFLRGSLAAAGLALLPRWALGAEGTPVDANRLALLSDTHIHADRNHVHKTGTVVWENLHVAAEQILAQPSRPAALLVNGDCAYGSGRKTDYATLIDALKPLRAAGIPAHLALGNHDDRANLLEAVPADERVIADVADRRVSVVPMPHADIYVLDSLDKTNKTPGVLGDVQLAWLSKALDARPNRAAMVMLHHQPDLRPLEQRSGLVDTDALLELVFPRKQVKAVLFGHTHVWTHRTERGLHFINLPTTAYVFRPEQPSGWVDAQVNAGALRLQLRCVTAKHPKDREVLELPYRANA